MNSIPLDACAVVELLGGRPAVVRIPITIDDAPITKEQSDASEHQRGIPSKNLGWVRMCANYVKCDSPEGSWCVSSRVDCPWGWPLHDVLWAQEAWAYYGGDEYLYQEERRCVAYRATWSDDRAVRAHNTALDYIPGGAWRDAETMPQWASRLTVRVERYWVECVCGVWHWVVQLTRVTT